MNRALILSSLVAAFMLVACDKQPGAGTAPGADTSKSGSTSSMGAPPSAASAASN